VPVNRSSTARAQAMNRRVEIRPVIPGP